jgi:hypothetical protein
MGTSSRNYYLVFEKLKKFKLSDVQVVALLLEVMQSESLSLQNKGASEELDITFQQLLWLMYVRAIQNDRKFVLFLPMYYDMIRAGTKTLHDLKDHLILTENTSYEPDFDIEAIPIEQMRRELKSCILRQAQA